MRSLQVRVHVDDQGRVTLNMPPEVAGQDVDLVMVFEPVTPRSPPAEQAPAEGWPPGFFEATAGAWQGVPLTREPEGAYERRDELQ